MRYCFDICWNRRGNFCLNISNNEHPMHDVKNMKKIRTGSAILGHFEK